MKTFWRIAIVVGSASNFCLDVYRHRYIDSFWPLSTAVLALYIVIETIRNRNMAVEWGIGSTVVYTQTAIMKLFLIIVSTAGFIGFGIDLYNGEFADSFWPLSTAILALYMAVENPDDIFKY
jgi:hypothetical protein